MMIVLIHKRAPFKTAELFGCRARRTNKTLENAKAMITVRGNDLDLHIRTIRNALGDPQYKHNVLAQEIFSARLTQLRLAAASQGR